MRCRKPDKEIVAFDQDFFCPGLEVSLVVQLGDGGTFPAILIALPQGSFDVVPRSALYIHFNPSSGLYAGAPSYNGARLAKF